MNKNILFNILLCGMITITAASLGALGEQRLDAYLSIYTLEYFTLLAILRPRRKTIDILAISLLTIFIIIVGYRVAEILVK